MKFQLNCLKHSTVATAATIILFALGLAGCDELDLQKPKDTSIPKIQVKNFIEPKIVDGNISLNHKITKEKLNVISCISEYKNACEPPKGSKQIGEQTATILIRTYQATVNSVLCTVTFEGPGYSFQVSWHEPGDTCSMGKPA